MNLRELLLKNRSYRRFYQDEKVSAETLKEFVENVRFTPSAANKQPLKFVLVTDVSMNEQIFSHLKWAAYLSDWDGPEQGERPSAYMVLLGNRKASPYIDADYGIAMQTVLLSAVEKGYGGCLIGSYDKEKVRRLLDIPEELELSVVIALGKPKEKVVVEPVKDDDIKYRRDEHQVHHVPKRSTEELIFKIV